MTRLIPELGLLYLAPFGAYVLYLIVRRAYLLSFDLWTRRIIAALSLSGLGLVLCGLLYTGFSADRHEGAYTPAHLENGRLVPGAIQ